MPSAQKPQASKYGQPRGTKELNKIVGKVQDGEVGTPSEGLQKAGKDFGELPQSGAVLANAGSKEAKRGSSTPNKGSPSKPEAAGSAKTGLQKPAKAGKGTGSIDTLTNLIFHPKGGLGASTSAKKPQGASGFKDSGAKGPPKKQGASR